MNDPMQEVVVRHALVMSIGLLCYPYESIYHKYREVTFTHADLPSSPLSWNPCRPLANLLGPHPRTPTASCPTLAQLRRLVFASIVLGYRL
jgi:hypothetical protein